MPAEPRIASVDEFADYVNVTDREGNERVLTRFLLGAEGLAERYARRRFSPGLRGVGNENVDYAFTTTTYGRTFLRVPDLRAVTSVFLNGAALTSTYDYDLGYRVESEPATHIDIGPTRAAVSPARRFGMVGRIGGFSGSDLVITGRWGFLAPPEEVVHAVLLIAAKSWKRRDAGYAETTLDEATGTLQVSQSMPGEAKDILRSYRPMALAFA